MHTFIDYLLMLSKLALKKRLFFFREYYKARDVLGVMFSLRFRKFGRAKDFLLVQVLYNNTT